MRLISFGTKCDFLHFNSANLLEVYYSNKCVVLETNCIYTKANFNKNVVYIYIYIYIYIKVFFTDTDYSQDSRGMEGPIFYSTLPLPPAHKHWDIYLQLCMWDDYHVFLISMFVFTRLRLDEIYHLIELPFEWLIDNAMFLCLLDELILGFCYSDLTLETSRFEFASIIISSQRIHNLHLNSH